MSEEERKEKYIVPRIVSYIALIAGITTFCCGLITIPIERLMANYFPDEFFEANIGAAITIAVFFLWIWFWYIAGICLVPTIVTLFIERDKRFRLLPLAFVMAGILLHAVFYTVFYWL